MSKASELMERVISRMEERGIPYNVLFVKNFHDLEIGGRYLMINEVYRHNGTGENVSVKISGDVKLSERLARTMVMIKVPKNASDKAIDRKIDEAEMFIKG